MLEKSNLYSTIIPKERGIFVSR
ncbi:hypothetical protein CCAND38_160010 [Capnocytophaga canis]|uniref:Uncharacterized protein n=1 Tax=Capnocytophaga canis TaxID=1848903 RepID=A0A0B7I310_9FLAO|nr:hypothetical protein CCAND38_160010 [Capnocytophaga canis]